MAKRLAPGGAARGAARCATSVAVVHDVPHGADVGDSRLPVFVEAPLQERADSRRDVVGQARPIRFSGDDVGQRFGQVVGGEWTLAVSIS